MLDHGGFPASNGRRKRSSSVLESPFMAKGGIKGAML